MNRSTKAVTTAGLGLFLLGALGAGVAAAAPTRPAEGSFTSNLNQVQPGFSSRQWIDNGSDGTATSVYLGGCAANKGGQAPGSLAIGSVKITLYRNGSSVGSASQKCGTYSFGNSGSGTYQFVVTAINGNTSANRTTFLNASTVTVRY